MVKKPQKSEYSSGQAIGSSANRADALPAFDQTTLQQLTKNVDVGLKRLHEDVKASKKKGSPSKVDENQKPKGPVKSPLALVPGKKRTINGTLKPVKQINGNNAKPKGINSGSAVESLSRASTSNSALIDEIRALGGDDDDLQLVGVVSSDSEAEAADFGPDDESTKQQLQQFEIQDFVKSLGINDLQDDESASRSTRPISNFKDEKAHQKNSVKPSQSSLPKVSTLQESRPVKTPKSASGLKFEPRPDWHAVQLLEVANPVDYNSKLSTDLSFRIYEYAMSLLDKENELYASKHLGSNSSRRFLSTIMSSGTLSDKVSALTLVIQESPLHNMKAFESLIGLARKRSRGQAVTALGALKDLLAQGTLLPSDRRLRAFHLQPALTHAFCNSRTWRQGDLLPANLNILHLLCWAYESWLKDRYFEILGILESWCNDEVQYARARAVGYVWELLKEKPEQESNLLRLLVNKLGDPDRKIASKTSFLLLQLQISHPLMKQTIISSIESELLFRPGQSLHAKYYAIVTLNQTILSTKEDSIAEKLLELYFGMFVGLLKRPDNPKAETLNPAPVAIKYNTRGERQGGGSDKGKKALSREKLDQTAKEQEEDLNEKMISAVLTGVNRAIPFSSIDTLRFSKHLDTLFRITHSSNFNTSIQALILIQQLTTALKVSSERFYRTLYESLLDPRIITSSKQTMYLNLLFRAMRDDLNVKRVKAFIKRLTQTLTLHQPPFICGGLYLIKLLEGTFPSIDSLVQQPELSGEDEDQEIFRDVDDGTDAPHLKEAPKSGPKDFLSKFGTYDGRKRDPEHSGAEFSCLWELTPFAHHFHPSVDLFATRLMEGGQAPMKPDFASHTLIHFLDRFIYRSARSTPDKSKGSSIMQSLPGTSSASVLMAGRSANNNRSSVNSEQFWRKQLNQVAADEVFFHQYFTHLGKSKTAQSRQEIRQKQKDGKDKEDGDENEDEIWKALVESRPELEGDMSSDGDLGFDDSEEDFEGYDDDDSGVDIEGDGTENSDLEMMDEAGTDLDVDDEIESSESDEGRNTEAPLTSRPTDLKQPGKNALQRNKKRKLKQLPTFASVDDYAELLAQEVDDLE